CLALSNIRIPRSHIADYSITYGCPIKAVVLTTRRGMKICVHPDDKWVRGIISELSPS
ncbi:C-C motif chemokine 18-like, partial [Odontesthes bonariensis]|uniref:C-C motif chemokine 18-like n=1 Tax=Odontesthes bonariensis TaxID=219752 RepID=UPI003F584CD3